MTWLDHVVATPTVGCAFKPSFQTSQEYMGALRPLLNKWAQTGDLGIVADKPMNLTVTRKPSGFSYSFEPEKIVVQFRYSYEFVEQPGQVLPELPTGFEVKKFSSLLEAAVEEYCEVFNYVVGSETRTLGRLGIVAHCRLDGKSLPPGVAVFVKYLAQPWGGSLAKCQAHLLGTISEDEKIRDRCHHQIDLNDDRKNDVRLTLDWQRLFLSQPQIGKGKLLPDHFRKCSAAALEYFERFGIGDLNYGNLD